MTVKADTIAVTPTQTAKNVFQARGVDVGNLMTLLQGHAADMITLCRQIVALHPNDSVLTASMSTAGSGGTNGPVTITGTSGTGTKFQATGVIAGGALTNPLVVTVPGSYTVDPSPLGAEPVTGGSLSGAKVALTISNDIAQLTALQGILAELM
jgi:hypothetical protein